MTTITLPKMLCAWFIAGALALLLTPLPARMASLGWAPLLWLLITPLLILLAVDPCWPLRLLAAWLRARQRHGRVQHNVRGCHRLYFP